MKESKKRRRRWRRLLELLFSNSCSRSAATRRIGPFRTSATLAQLSEQLRRLMHDDEKERHAAGDETKRFEERVAVVLNHGTILPALRQGASKLKLSSSPAG
jgi:hypothetical protein